MTPGGFVVLSVASGLGVTCIFLGVMYVNAEVGHENLNPLLAAATAPFAFALAIVLLNVIEYLSRGVIR